MPAINARAPVAAPRYRARASASTYILQVPAGPITILAVVPGPYRGSPRRNSKNGAVARAGSTWHPLSPVSREATDTSASREAIFRRSIANAADRFLNLTYRHPVFDDPETLPDWMKRRETGKAEDRG